MVVGAVGIALVVPAATPLAFAQTQSQPAGASDAHPEFPAGVGRDVTLKLCANCHSPNIILAYGQNRIGWENTITKMVRQGAEGTDEDFTEIADYLIEHFPPSTVQKIFVNMATDKQLAAVLEITPEEAKAIVDYRDKAKGFQTIEDIKRVPDVDTKKIDAKKDRLVFGEGVKP
jgi:competence protein ComEA